MKTLPTAADIKRDAKLIAALGGQTVVAEMLGLEHPRDGWA